MKSRRGISYRLAWAGLAVALALGAVFGISQLTLDFNEQNKRINDLAERILLSAELPAHQAARMLDNALAGEVVKGMFVYDFVVHAKLTDELNTVLGEMSRTVDGENRLFVSLLDEKTRTFTIKLFDKANETNQFGVLELTINRGVALSAFFDRVLFIVVADLISAILLVVVLSLIFHQILTEPLLRLIGQLQKIDPASTSNIRTEVSPNHRHDELGVLSTTINTIIDMNESHLCERKRKEIELVRYQTIVASSRDFQSFITPDYRYAAVSGVYVDYFGVKIDEIVGKTIGEIVGDDYFYRTIKPALDRALKGDVVEFEAGITKTGKSDHLLAVHMEPYFEKPGVISGVIFAGRDITEERRVEDKIKNALEVVKHASDSKSRFLANMSHELRSPLNAIIGFSQMINTETFGPIGQKKYKEYAADISMSGHHLLDLITDILDVSKIEVGAIRLNMEQADLSEIVVASVAIIRGSASQKGLTLSLNMPEGELMLMSDSLRMRQVVVNLLSNAIKFTPPEGEVRIDVSGSCENGYMLVVCDTGCGIASEDIPHALEPFGQVGDIYTRTHEGAGLGLYLAKMLTELNGGTLEIESIPGEGTSVSIKFPGIENT